MDSNQPEHLEILLFVYLIKYLNAFNEQKRLLILIQNLII